MLYIRFILPVFFASIHAIQIAIVENNIMMDTANNVVLNTTRNQCICDMISFNQQLTALNYFANNRTCQLFSLYNTSIVIQDHLNSSFIFLNQSLISLSMMQLKNMTSSYLPVVNGFWSFDGDYNDQNGNYNGTSINNVSFVSPGITGYGSALYFNGSLNQSIQMNYPNNFNISFQSFTFQLWIYLFSLSTGDLGMIGQCQSYITCQCLHMTIRNTYVRISFYNNSCTSPISLSTKTWYHLTFVYNYSATNQQIYVDGILTCDHWISAPLQIMNLTSSPLTIGWTSPYAPNYFDGLMDRVFVVNWAKNSTEILDDATLVAWYIFDSSSPLGNSGVSEINGVASNLFIENNSLLFNQTPSSFQSYGFVLLGVNNRSYSFSIWVNPFQINNASILLISPNTSNSTKWCLPFLGFNTQGNLQVQSPCNGSVVTVQGPSIVTYKWAHIVQTYSFTNGLSLYVNGLLFNSSSSCDYRSGNIPLAITLGNSLANDNITCSTNITQVEQYWGRMDDFRVFSRELTTNDVQILFNTSVSS